MDSKKGQRGWGREGNVKGREGEGRKQKWHHMNERREGERRREAEKNTKRREGKGRGEIKVASHE